MPGDIESYTLKDIRGFLGRTLLDTRRFPVGKEGFPFACTVESPFRFDLSLIEPITRLHLNSL